MTENKMRVKSQEQKWAHHANGLLTGNQGIPVLEPLLGEVGLTNFSEHAAFAVKSTGAYKLSGARVIKGGLNEDSKHWFGGD